VTEEGRRPKTHASGQRLSDRALERRVKRWLLSGPFDCFIQTAPGLETILAEELRSAGLGGDRAVERGGVAMALDHVEIMRANLALRTASRVLLRLATFPAPTHEMLFDRAARIPWEVHLGTADAYGLRIASRASRLQAGDAVATTISRAVSRRLRALGLRPRLAEDAALTFRIRLLDDRCTVSLDTSGEHLHRRGVRRHVHHAPVRETIAAALALAALGDHDVVVDPFCGSGTLLLEVADLAAGRPPGRGRSFAFQSAAWHRPGRWREVQRLAAAHPGAGRGAQPRVIGMDVDPDALAAARHNLSGAEHRRVELVRGDATTIALDGLRAERGLLIGNLPYGVRLGGRAGAAATIVRFLDRCAEASSPWDVALLTTHPELIAEHPAVRVRDERAIESGGLRVSRVVGRTRPASARRPTAP
jgi:putative N6-adenine-specific DNA methylase